MKVTAGFCVESGGKCYEVDMTVHISDSELRFAPTEMLFDYYFSRMSRKLSADMIRNTTMLAHLVTHPDDAP